MSLGKNYRKEEAKQIVEACLARLNQGEKLEAVDIERALGDHIA